MNKALVAWLRRKTTIKFRIYLFSGVMLFLFYFASIFSFITQLNDVKAEKYKSIEFMITELLSKTAGQALWRGNKEPLESVMQTLLDSTEVHSIVILDNQGDVFTTLGSKGDTTNNMQHLDVDVVWEKLAAEFGELDLDTDSVSEKKEVIGEIRVLIDQDAISELVWAAMIQKSYTLIIALLLSMPVVYILAISLVKPLTGIMNDLNRFKVGDYSPKTSDREYKDEYALLSSTLAEAWKSISNKTLEIKEANQNLKRHSEELENQVRIAIEARKAADEAIERKDIFVANMTHEFNTPLSGIVTVLKLIEDEIYKMLSQIDDTETGNVFNHTTRTSLRENIFKTTNYVDTARFASNEISQMVNEILASIQDIYDDIHLNERQVRLTQSLERLLKPHELYAKQKGLEFEMNCSGCEDVWIFTDWIRVAQILNALISNAIKFTEKGKVIVNIRILTTSEHVSVFVDVQDTGIGVTEKEKDAIFELFHIGQHPRNKLAPGIGTGLAIAKKISEKLGGNISLKSSALKAGSCFTFDCTFNRVLPGENVANEDELLEKGNVNTNNIRLLYVEDSILNQMIFQRYCIKHGVNLIIANNGEDGYEKYTKGSFDALVVDCYMPFGDGFEMVSKIREHEKNTRNGRSLIFALTGDDSEKNRKRCKEYGLDEFIAKPYSDEAHLFLLEKVMAYKDPTEPNYPFI